MRHPRPVLYLIALWAAAGCTGRLYAGPQRPTERIALIHVGSVIVRQIDGDRRRGGAFDVSRFEVPPGTHRLTLVFELPARTYGLKSLPAQSGEGTCELVFAAEAGKQYYLGARPRGEPTSRRWRGEWEAWVRDPTVSAEDDIIARCDSRPSPGDEATPARATPIPSAPIAAAPATPVAPPTAATPSAAPAAPALAAPPPVAVPPAVPPPAAAPAAPPPAPKPSFESIRLGTWNVRNLGRRPEQDVGRIALVIEQHFDVLTLTEIAHAAGGHPGYDRLLAALGPGWGGLVSDTPRPPGDGGEYYAVVYRRDRVRPCQGWERLRTVSPSNAFVRAPDFACLEAGDLDAPGIDFLLAAYRAPFADGDAAVAAADVARLGDAFTAMKLARPGEDDLIIAGNFNLESVELAHVLKASDHTIGDGSKLNLLGDRTSTLPDHILVFDDLATTELLGEAEALDVRGIAPSHEEFYRTVSDHLPIMLRLSTFGRDDD
jgi:hypothetical protein